jgi:hypothetical protein
MDQVGVLPDDARGILGKIEIGAACGRRYCFEMLHRRISTYNGAQNRLRVFVSDQGTQWSPLPMDLDLRSRVIIQFTSNWPPETLDSVSTDSGLVIRFHDTEYGMKSAYPGGFFSESIWEARYDERRHKWSIARIRKLTDSDWPLLKSLL